MDAILKLCDYQKRWLQDKSRYKIGLWARQTGKTFVATLEIVDDIYEQLSKGLRTTWIILSGGERQSKEALESCKRHCNAYRLAFSSLEEDHEQDGVSYRVLQILFPNGSRILSFPANPATIRGWSGNLYFDEAAFWKDSESVWRAAAPIATRGKYKVRMTSTPAGKQGVFYRLWTGADNAWSKHRTDIYEAIKQGLELDIEELRKGIDDEDTWKTEYELEWLDEASAWLSYELIQSCEDPNAGKPELYQGGPCFFGNDIGRKNDLWAAAILELVGDVFWMRELVTLKRQNFATQDAKLDELVQKYCTTRICIDKTGMGEKPVEDAERRYGKYRVEGVHFTNASKLHLATIGKQTFEDRKIRIPQGDNILRTDLHKLKKTVTPIGNFRFDCEADSNGHADRTWAIFLALYGGSSQVSGYRSFGSKGYDGW